MKPFILTPLEFELQVRVLLEAVGPELQEYHVAHREKLHGLDGDYEIDITARFKALDVQFLVLVECKHHNYPIKREVVQISKDRLQSVGAHKGIIYSTADFQSGAVEYAIRHGIALIKVFPFDPDDDNSGHIIMPDGTPGGSQSTETFRPTTFTSKPFQTLTITNYLKEIPWACALIIRDSHQHVQVLGFRHSNPVPLTRFLTSGSSWIQRE